MNAFSVGSLSMTTDNSKSNTEHKLHMGKLINKCTNSPFESFGLLT